MLILLSRLDAGGAETHVATLSRELTAMGHSVIVASEGGLLVRDLLAGGTRVHQLPLLGTSEREVRDAAAGLQQIIELEDVDVVHIHEHALLPVGVLAALRSNRPWVFTVHTSMDLVTEWLWRFGAWFYEFSHFALSEAAAVLAVSEGAADRTAIDYQVDRGHLTVIHNGIDVDAFSFVPRTAPTGPIRLLQVSRLDEDRRAATLAALELLRELLDAGREAELTLAGDGTVRSEIEASVAALAPQAGGGRVHLLGARTDIPELMAGHDVVLGAGRALMEAMATGRVPVLGGVYGLTGLMTPESYPRLMAQNLSGRDSAPLSPKVVATELLGLLDDPAALAARLGAMREIVVTNHDLSAVAARTSAAYRDAVRGGPPRSTRARAWAAALESGAAWRSDAAYPDAPAKLPPRARQTRASLTAMAAGDSRAAIRSLQTVLRDSRDPNAAAELARLLLADGRPAEAVEALEPVLGTHPESIGVRLQYGAALGQLGRFDDAREILSRALEYQPENAHVVWARLMVDVAERDATIGNLQAEIDEASRRAASLGAELEERDRAAARRILLAGYFGFGNVGDEAILHATVGELQQLIPEAELVVVSGNPDETEAAHGVRAISYDSIRALSTEMEGADLVLMPGGGLFHDYFGFDPSATLGHRPGGLAFSTSFPLLAGLLHRPLQMSAMGIGPLASEVSREHARRAFELADVVTVRDEESRLQLVSMGLDGDRVAVTADPAFLLRPAGAAAARRLIPEDWRTAAGPLVGVVLREWNIEVDGAQWPLEVAAALDSLVERDGARVIFVPFQSVDYELTDVAIAERVRAAMRHSDRAFVLEPGGTAPDVAAVIGQFDVILGMRLHATILAAVSGVPTVGLVYDPKDRHALGQLGLEPYCVELRGVTARKLAKRVRGALAGRDEIRATLKTAVASQRRHARKDLRRAAALARAGRAGQARLPADYVTEILARAQEQVAEARAELRVAGLEIERQEREHTDATDSLRKGLADATRAVAGSEARHADTRALLEIAERRLADGERQLAGASARTTVAETETVRLLEAVHYNERWLQELYRSRGWRILQGAWTVRNVARPSTWVRAVGSRLPNRRRIGLAAYARLRPAAKVVLPQPLRHSLRPWVQRRLLAPPALPPAAPPMGAPAAVGVTEPPRVQAQAVGEGPEVGSLAVGIRAHRAVQPLISVLLPVYNHADMLLQAAGSVLRQSHENLELIIVDDGSSDEIEPVLTELLADTRVRVLRQPNQKLPRALTHASAAARGEFISWTSADNVMGPRMLETLLGVLLRDPEATLAYADVALIDAHGRPLLDRSYRPQNLDAERPDVLRLPRSTESLGHEADNFINASFLYRAEGSLALEGTYPDDLRGLEDYDFWLRLQRAGGLRHAENREPMYAYRVHSRTMSDELLTKERDAHLKRGEMLMRHEATRRAYGDARWTLSVDTGLDPESAEELRAAAARLPVDVAQGADGSATDGRKTLRVVGRDSIGDTPPYIRVLPQAWQLVWTSPWTGERRWLVEWKGRDTDPLVRKARDTARNTWEFAQAGERVVIGSHLPLGPAAVDVRATRRTIESNPDLFFVFLLTDASERSLARRIVSGLENAVELGARTEAQAYRTYACMDAFWIPPCEGPLSEHLHRSALVLSLAAGRPLLVPRGEPSVAAPYQLWYEAGAALGPVAGLLRGFPVDETVLDAYLGAWSRSGALRRVLRLADAATQESAAARPTFVKDLPVAVPPTEWRPPGFARRSRLRCALLVDSLDRGGLEDVVAQLALELPSHSVDTFVLCAQGGGEAARRLDASGRRVYVAGSDPASIGAVLAEERPDVISSHYAGLATLAATRGSGIDIVETIHNTYAWLDSAGWQVERQRSGLFRRAIAVSRLVKDYYSRWNPKFPPDRITVVPNFADTALLTSPSQAAARTTLGVPPEEFLFVWAASYDARKNQLGLLVAFDEVARSHPDVRLICMGNAADPIYHAKLVELQSRLPSADRIELRGYSDDLAAVLPAADAFVVPSFFEGWSVAATQALALGVPLIHTESGSGPELVGAKGERGILIPNPAGDPIDLAWGSVEKVAWQEAQPNRRALVDAMSRMVRERSAWSARRDRIRRQAMASFGPAEPLERYRTVLAGDATADASPPADFRSELAFWEKELSLEGDFADGTLDQSVSRRAHRRFPVELVAPLERLQHELHRTPEVLDVGSGPISVLSDGHRRGLLRLTAIDPLAAEYQRLVDRFGYESPGLRAGRGESLSEQFGEGAFDLVWCHNALDHAQDLRKVMLEMVRVLRPGGLLWLSTWTREASAQGHEGLHQHDLVWRPGNQLIRESHSNGDRPEVLNADLPLELVDASPPTEERALVHVVWRKTGAARESRSATAPGRTPRRTARSGR